MLILGSPRGCSHADLCDTVRQGPQQAAGPRRLANITHPSSYPAETWGLTSTPIDRSTSRGIPIETPSTLELLLWASDRPSFSYWLISISNDTSMDDGVALHLRPAFFPEGTGLSHRWRRVSPFSRTYTCRSPHSRSLFVERSTFQGMRRISRPALVSASERICWDLARDAMMALPVP
jgi:hypothetical protein